MLTRIPRLLTLLGVAFVTLALFGGAIVAQVGGGLNGTDEPAIIFPGDPEKMLGVLTVNGRAGVVNVPDDADMRVVFFTDRWGREGEPGYVEPLWCLDICVGTFHHFIPVVGREYVDLRLPILPYHEFGFAYELTGMIPEGETHNMVSVFVRKRGGGAGDPPDGPGGMTHDRAADLNKIPLRW